MPMSAKPAISHRLHVASEQYFGLIICWRTPAVHFGLLIAAEFLELGDNPPRLACDALLMRYAALSITL